MSDQDKNAEQVAGLRAAADWLEQHPEYTFGNYTAQLMICEAYGVDGLAQLARAFGKCKKESTTDLFMVSRTFGPLKLWAAEFHSAICTRKVVGKRILPAVEAIPEREVDVVEWECPPSLLKEVSA